MSPVPGYLDGGSLPDATAADEGKAVIVTADGSYELTDEPLATTLDALDARITALEAP